MSCLAKPESSLKEPAHATVTLGAFLDTLALTPNVPLVFRTGEAAIAAGYHVTEVKAALFSSLDCGAERAQWQETLIQLLDAGDAGEAFMSAGKFLGIVRKVEESLDLAMDRPLIFEVSNGHEAMKVFAATAPVHEEGALTVHLAPSAARCKPAMRAREPSVAAQTHAAACCSPSSGAQASACCAG